MTASENNTTVYAIEYENVSFPVNLLEGISDADNHVQNISFYLNNNQIDEAENVNC